ncbi:hypothetical protein E8D34_03410 [Nocardioides sp. GY 10113]|uniref:hypothetical protein n=1 Tax=Nocardioides sp. GY 10113 TaxID=2569761 RepID=UPI0010A8998E|nr:hypothetical protein [Nocardioides sp. GY 10113]TIC88728.1 hypothetical protein E8D34_03410 [Nocardioides sp. GY 10113]
MVAADRLAAADDWFAAHGLPYFVPERRADVRRALRLRRTLPLALVVGLLAVAAGVGLAGAVGELSAAPATLVAVGLGVALWYALTALHARQILTWGLGRTVSSLRAVLPLTTRALPLLLMAITFLFINTEVWQVAANLTVASLWLVVVLFAALAVAFLLVRLPEEVDRADDAVDAGLLRRACAGTPLEGPCEELLADDEADPAAYAEVTGYERWNLILVLLVVNAVQVLLLSVAVFAFLMVFGSIVMTDAVLTAWQASETFNAGRALVQVSVFLAAFSGLYLTVSTVTDEAYRTQFFGGVTRELERAVGVRAVYLALRARSVDV